MNTREEKKWKWFYMVVVIRCVILMGYGSTHSQWRGRSKWMNNLLLLSLGVFFDKKNDVAKCHKVSDDTIATGNAHKCCKTRRFFDELYLLHILPLFSLSLFWLIWLNVNLHHFNSIKNLLCKSTTHLMCALCVCAFIKCHFFFFLFLRSKVNR